MSATGTACPANTGIRGDVSRCQLDIWIVLQGTPDEFKFPARDTLNI